MSASHHKKTVCDNQGRGNAQMPKFPVKVYWVYCVRAVRALINALTLVTAFPR